MKPHRGKIDRWAIFNWHGTGRYIVIGKSVGHPQFDGRYMHTTNLVNMKFENGRPVQIETMNSIYDLGDPA
jgi:hypothetical protein